RRNAVDGVSLSLPEGAVYALLGRNGAGKSSLVRCLLGQQRATAGRALLFGRDAWRHRATLMAQVGVVPEQPDAPPGVTARQLARLCRPLYPCWDGSGFEARLRRFDVPADRPFGRLSKGQQGHVALALALAPHPRLLILDDPTLGLDAVARRAFFEELIGDLADRGTTVLLTTHDLAAVERIADRAGILAGGRLLLDEEIERLKQRFRHIWLPSPTPGADAALDALSPRGRVRRNWRVETLVENFDEERFQAFQASPSGAGAEASPLTLEEIFVALTGEGSRQLAPGAEGDPR
ncbi:MAG TPA: ABC transporter ATP-binding protein, partial [Thermoanaerobaculia bacterium]|nr:ABC transporter ATP-binding protein [Thermoanaerobaculia bacterium]